MCVKFNCFKSIVKPNLGAFSCSAHKKETENEILQIHSLSNSTCNVQSPIVEAEWRKGDSTSSVLLFRLVCSNYFPLEI